MNRFPFLRYGPISPVPCADPRDMKELQRSLCHLIPFSTSHANSKQDKAVWCPEMCTQVTWNNTTSGLQIGQNPCLNCHGMFTVLHFKLWVSPSALKSCNLLLTVLTSKVRTGSLAAVVTSLRQLGNLVGHRGEFCRRTKSSYRNCFQLCLPFD